MTRSAECQKIIQDALGLTAREAKDVIDELFREAERRNGPTDAQLIAKIAAERESDKLWQAAVKERQAAISAVKQSDAWSFISQFNKYGEGLHSLLVGRKDFIWRKSQRVLGGQLSVATHQQALYMKVFGPFINELEKGHDGIRKMFKNKQFGEAVAKEMWAGAKQSVTGNEYAFHAAKTIDRYKEIIRTMANDEGAEIARHEGHIFAQFHDPSKIQGAGYKAWKDSILPRLDEAKTFKGADSEDVLRNIYRSIMQDHYGVYTQDTGRVLPANLANRMGGERYLHFKSADDFIAYNRVYGAPAMMENVFHSMAQRVREVGTMQKLGPNPEATMDKLIGRAAEADQPTKLAITKQDVDALRRELGAVTGSDRVPVNLTAARMSQGARNLAVLSKLGGSMIASFNDVVAAMSEATYMGRGYLSGMADITHSLATGLPKDARVADMMVTFNEGLLHDIGSRLMTSDSRVGTTSRMANTFFKWNGLNWWTERMKGGYAWMMAQHLGEHLSHDWATLNPRLKANLFEYGIDDAAWKHLQAAGTERLNGKQFVTADMVKDAATADKLRSWFVAEADIAVPTPGARERALALRGTQPGTFEGETMRFLWQFKMFSLTMLTKVLPRTIEQGVPGVTHLAVMGSIFGYASNTLKDIAAGRVPRDPTDPKTIVAAWQSAGGLGILGDALFNDYNSDHRSLAEIAAGPVFGGFGGDITRLYSTAVRPKEDVSKYEHNLASQSVATLLHNAPYANLYFLRAALNYGLIYHVQELVNPGVLRRIEDKVKRESGQDFIRRPSSVVKYGGGF